MEGTPRPEKVAIVDELKERLDASGATVVTAYRGLNVPEMADLRSKLREAGGEYKVYKNTLVRLAIGELELDQMADLFVGPTALAFVQDDVSRVAKALKDFAKDNPNLVIKGGVLSGEVLDATQIDALADLPSREDLLARLAGGLAAPAQQFAGLLHALLARFGYAVQALIAEGGAEGAPAAEPGPAAESERAAQDTEPAAESETAAQDTEPAAESETAAQDTEPAAESETAAQDTEPAAESESAAQDTEPAAESETAAQDTEPAAESESPGESEPAAEVEATAEAEPVEATGQDESNQSESNESGEQEDGDN